MGKTITVTYDPGTILTRRIVISFDYDNNGNLKTITNPKAVFTTFDYTGVNVRKTMTMPLSGIYLYTYDTEKNLKSIIFPSGKQRINTYTNGLLASTVTPEGMTAYTYTCGDMVESITKGSESITYTHDGTFLLSDTRAGLINDAITYTYNNDFNPASRTYAGITQTLGYDSDTLLVTASPFTITRNTQNGFPVSITDGTLTATRSFSGYGELDGTTYAIAGSNRYGYSLTRDNTGRIKHKEETVSGTLDTYDYGYDDTGRLLEAKKNNTVTESYTYDPNGNRQSELNTLRGINRTYTVNNEDHVITAGSDSYLFNVDGFLTQKTTAQGTMTTQYSSRGELLSATLPNGTVITYDHDPTGRRITKKVNGTITEKYLWETSTRLLAIYDGSGNLVSRFTYVDTRMPVSMSYNGSTYYLVYDQIGSLRAVIDTSGTIVKRIDYDAYGSIITDTNPAMTIPLGFAGGLFDKDTGLIRFGVRDYDPSIGRWTAKDPIDFAGGDTNLYGYVMNDPVNWIDPEGLWFDGLPYNDSTNETRPEERQDDASMFLGPDAYRGAPDLPLEEPWIDPTMLIPGGGAAGKCILKIEVKLLSGKTTFRVVSKRLKMGFRIDPSHHGKGANHPHFWRW